MNRIYLDNAATTALLPEAKAAMTAAMENYGNPSSIHETGLAAGALLKEAHATVAEHVFGERFARDGQLIFTASGSEATALALFGVTHAKTFPRGSVILTTEGEHPSVEKNLQRLEAEGFIVRRLSTVGGCIDKTQLAAYCAEKPVLVSVMLVNNETGARYPVEEIFAAARAANPACVCHTDAVQGLFKTPTALKSLGADLITVSAHKIHGPKGVGALFLTEPILKAKKLVPLFLGGGQENGFRSGTENTVALAGFAAAAKEGAERYKENVAHLYALSSRLIKGLAGTECRVNLPPVRAGHIVSVTLPDIKSETALHYLSGRGIAVSAGSACSAHKHEKSRALLAFGLTERQADCTLRVSFCDENTEADVDALLAALAEGLSTLVRIRH